MLKDLAFWAQVAFRFLLRSPRTTAALSLMIISAVSVMIFLSAMCVGINDAMIRNSIGLYPGHISGFGLPAGLDRDRLLISGVKNALKRVAFPGILSRGQIVESITLIEVDPDQEAKSTALIKKTIAGRYLQRERQEVYLSSSTAQRLKIQPGDTIHFRLGLKDKGFPLTVSGVYQTGFEQLDRGIAFCPEHGVPAPDTPWIAAVFLKEGTDPSMVIAAYHKSLPGAGRFQSWTELMPDLKQLIDLNFFSMGIVQFLVFGVVSLGVGCAFVIFIFKNLREFAIMRALGVTSREIATLLIFEVTSMSLAASCLAMLLGTLVTLFFGRIGIDLSQMTSHNRYFTVSGMIFPRLTSFSLLIPPILASFAGLLASLWPAALVARRRPADILRVI